MMAEGENGNLGPAKALSSSAEDLSEYTDADESISSAPTEFLAEFLSAVMLKDYKKALKYCHLILQYEPNNSTAKEFYPLIVTKLRMESNKSSGSSDNEIPHQKDVNSESSSDSESSGNSGDADDDEDEEEEEEEQLQNNSSGSGDRHSDRTTASYSSLEDDDDANNFGKYSETVDNADFGNGNVKIGSTSPPVATKKAWETTMSEKELFKKMDHITLNIHASSDSESPTEPVSQQLIAQLRSRVINSCQD